jgi:hypothetical protein
LTVREEGTAKVAPLLAIVATDRATPDMAKAMSALPGDERPARRADRAAAQLETQITALEAKPQAMHKASARSRRSATVAGIESVNCERSCLLQSLDPPNKALANWRIVAFIIIMRYTDHSQGLMVLGMPIDAREREPEHIWIEPLSVLVALATSTNEIGLLDSVLAAAVGR